MGPTELVAELAFVLVAEHHEIRTFAGFERSHIIVPEQRGAIGGARDDRFVGCDPEVARRERDAWQNWPPRVAADMAAELGVDAHTMEQVLDRHLRKHLAEMADVEIELR